MNQPTEKHDAPRPVTPPTPATPVAPPAGPPPPPPRPAGPPRYDLRQEVLEQLCTWVAIRASGPGGQHRNKSYTGVRLTHPPSGVVVTATERRSQAQNLEMAYERLVERLKALMHRDKPRKPTKVPASVDRKRLEEKRHRANLKRQRGSDGD